MSDPTNPSAAPDAPKASVEKFAPDQQGLVSKFIKQAISYQLGLEEQDKDTGPIGTEFYDLALQSGQARNTVRPVIDHLRRTDSQYDGLDAKTIDDIDEDIMRRYVISYGIGIENSRNTLTETILAEFMIDSADRKKVSDAVKKLSLWDLQRHIDRVGERQKLINRTFGVDAVKVRDIWATLDDLGLADSIKNLSRKQTKILNLIMTDHNHHVSEEDVRILLPLFRTQAQKKALLARFLPSISIGTLRDNGIRRNDKATEQLARDQLGKNEMLRTVPPEEILRYHSIDSIYVSTSLLSDAEVDKLFETIGLPDLAREINRSKTTIRNFQDNPLNEPVTENEWVTEEDLGVMEENKKLAYVQKIGKTKKDYPLDVWKNLFDVIEPRPTIQEREELEATYGNFDFRQKLIDCVSKKCPQITNPEKIGPNAVIRGSLSSDVTSPGSVMFLRIDSLDEGVSHPMVSFTNLSTPDNSILAEDPSRGIVGVKETLSYDDFMVWLEKINANPGPKVFGAADLAGAIASHEIHESVPDDKIGSPAELKKKLDVIDTAGSSIPVSVGMTLELNKGSRTKFDNLGICSISRIENNHVWITDGQETHGPLTFTDIYETVKREGGRRLTSVHTRTDCIATLRNQAYSDDSKTSSIFLGMEIEGDRLIETSRKKDNKPAEVKYLRGPEGTLIQIDSMNESTIDITFLSGYDLEKKSYKESTACATYTYEMFFFLVKRYGCNEVYRPGEKNLGSQYNNDVKIHEESDFGKRFFQGICLKDIMMGLKQGGDLIKHSLEYNSSLNASKFLYGLGKNLKWLPIIGGEEGMLELKSKILESDGKLLEQTKSKLDKNWSGADRRKMIEKILLSKASRAPEVLGAMLCMLEKSGGLYSESSMGQYQGSRLWFRKLCKLYGRDVDTEWTKYSEKYQKDFGMVPTEEGVIWLWAKSTEGLVKTADFPPNYHSKYLSAWNTGRKDGGEKGMREAHQINTLAGRVNYAMKKAEGGEYSIAFYGHDDAGENAAAMRKIFDKSGTGPDSVRLIWKLPMFLLMGRACEDMPPSALQKIRYLFQEAHYNYPPFLFAERQDLVDIFRKTVRRLVELKGDKDALKQLDTIDELRKHGNKREELTKAFSDFWDAHGDYLMPRLNTVRDRTIVEKQDEPVFKQYYSHLQGFYNNEDFRKSPNKSELGEDVYAADHTPVPIKIMGHWVKFTSQGTIQSESDKVWKGIVSMIKDVPNLRKDPTKDKSDPVNRAYQKNLFQEYICDLMEGIRSHISERVDMTKTLYGKDLLRLGVPPAFLMDEDADDLASYFGDRKYNANTPIPPDFAVTDEHFDVLLREVGQKKGSSISDVRERVADLVADIRSRNDPTKQPRNRNRKGRRGGRQRSPNPSDLEFGDDEQS